MSKPGLHISSKMLPNAVGMIKEVLAAFPQIKVIWTYATFPDHNNQRSADFMVTIEGMPRTEQVKLGNDISAYLTKHAERLGVNGIIWNRRVKGFPHAPDPPYVGPYGKWRTYYGTKSHTDHVHVEVDDRKYTPLTKPKPAAPKPKPIVSKPTVTYFIDPAKFHNKTSKLAVVSGKTGKWVAWREQGHKFVGVKTVTRWGKKWVVNEDGNLLSASYVTKVKAGAKPA